MSDCWGVGLVAPHPHDHKNLYNGCSLESMDIDDIET